MQSDLEDKLTEARNLNNNLQTELDKLGNNHANTERELRSQVDTLTTQANLGKSEWKARYDNLDRVHQELRSALLRQDKVTTEVKQEASTFLNQMRALSERSNESQEREESLVRQLHKLEKETQDWKGRYARKRTQARTFRASAMTISLQQADAGQVAKDGDFTAQDGLVKDIHVTRFQIAIDELLQSARGDEPNAVLTRVKPVVLAVRDITIDLGDTQSSQDEAMQQSHKLRARVSATANNLITASKNFAMSKGLSPVSLLDAAASHLTSAIIELIRLVKIRPTPAQELEEQEENDFVADSPADYYGMSQVRESTGAESVYSTVTDPRRSVQPATQGKAAKVVQNGFANGAQNASGSRSTHGMYKSPDNKMEELRVGFPFLCPFLLVELRLTIPIRLSWNSALTSSFPSSKPSSPPSGRRLNLQKFSTTSQPLYPLRPKSLPKRTTPRPASSQCKSSCSRYQNALTNLRIKAGKERALMTIGIGTFL